MAVDTDVRLTQVLPRGPTITCLLKETSTYGPSSAGASGGLQQVERPLRKAAVQWYDAPIWELSLPLILENESGGNVESECLILEGWIDNTPGATQLQVLQISGPVPGRRRYWMCQNVSFTDAIRAGDGSRIQQSFTLTLWEYSPLLASALVQASPAQRSARSLTASIVSSSGRSKYTVRAGDTLGSIAARQLGNYRLWTQIAQMNGIRDPASIVAGQVLVLP